MGQEAGTDSNLGTFGCVLVVMGSMCAIAGVAELFGISPVSSGIELDFFGIALDTPGERLWWILGSLIAVAIEVFLLRADDVETDKS